MIRLSIRRPVAVAMLYISVALLGVAAWRNIPVELLPDVTFPQLSVYLQWPGASPETVEAFATSPVESAIQQVKGVEKITSTTQEGSATITVEFERETDMEFARLELTERLANLEEELPNGVRPLRIQPYVPDEFEEQATRPFLAYTFTGPFLIEALRLHLDDIVVPELLRIRGVSEVRVDGGRDRLLEIELDPDKISALGLRPEQVQGAVQSLDLVREAGAVRQGQMEWAVTIRTRPVSAADLRAAILPVNADVRRQTPVRLGEVAEVRDTFEDPTSHYRINGSPALSFRVYKEYGTNTVRLAERVKSRVEELEALNPPGASLILTDDQSDEIRSQLTDLRTRAAIAGVVIFLVLLAFFRSFRTAGVVFATIAFSILISLNLLYFGGLTLNVLTLMGLALGFGLIVDNSIVVLENIIRKRQGGTPAEEAARTGARDVVLPILASTLTTLIVFLPFLYLQGELRIYYLPLAIVVGLTLVASIFVAFTFIPALAARMLRGRAVGAGVVAGASGAGDAGGTPEESAGAHGRTRPPLYIRFYSGLLGYSLRFPWATVAVGVVCFASSYYVFDRYVTRGRVWGFGVGTERSYIDINITLPRGSDLERVDQLARYFEDRLAQMPEVSRFTTNVSGTQSRTRVDFPEELEFTAVPLVIQERLVAESLGFTGADVRVYGRGPSFYGGSGGAAPNYRITILGYNYDRLAEIAGDLGRRLERNSRIQEVDTNATAGFTRDRAVEYLAEIDRAAVARNGITVREAVSLINGFLRNAGRSGQVMIGGEAVDFEIRLEGFRQADVDELLGTVLATSRGTRVPVGDLINVSERNVLTSIRRENQQYERTVAYEFRGPRALGDVVRDAALDATVLPAGYSLEERSPFVLSIEDQQQMLAVLLVAIGLIFMVTAGLFESVRQPLCVLLAVPMALIGVFLTFFYVNATFTREAYIGVIMMGGIVVNNAILLIDHVNRVRAERGGLTLERAVVQGTLERVRPILMTTATTVLGLLPLVLFTPSADATIWNAFTYSLIGGLLSSTLFVLTITPALYFLFERGKAAEAASRKAAVVRGAVPAPGVAPAEGRV